MDRAWDMPGMGISYLSFSEARLYPGSIEIFRCRRQW